MTLMKKPFIGLVEACELIERKQLTIQTYLSQCVGRADDLESTLKAFTVRSPLLKMLHESGAGPLKGIPVAIKDILATKDFVTTNGSPIYGNYIPMEDAPIVQKIRALGGVVFGKTVTTEFAWKHPGATTNPWNRGHTPGGSSSGSAAAVASGIVPLAIGSQTVGSIVRPASFCGVVGFKASFGAVPRAGAHPVSGSLDHIGFFTRSVKDIVYAFNLLKNISPSEEDAIVIEDVSLKPLEKYTDNRRLRIALLKTPFDDLLSQEQSDVLQSVANNLKSEGASVEDYTLPDGYWDGIQALHILMACEAAVIHEHHFEKYPELMSTHMKELVQKGNNHTASEYIKAKKLQQRLRQSIGEIFERFDVILSAPATGEAPKGLDFTGNPIFCALWSFIGTPAIALPVTKSAKGLPLGIQLIGNYRDDEKLLNIAAFVEASIEKRSN